MKRDMDLIRKILLEIEGHPEDEIGNISVDGYSHEQIAYHVYLLHDAKLVEGKILYGQSSVKPVNYVIFRMTWAGHDFLDASRDETRWQKAKRIIDEKVKGASFDIIKLILLELMKEQANRAFT